MSAQAQQQQSYTPTEYLALEECAEYKSEYHNGEIIAITGRSFNHNRIAVNVSAALNFYFKNQENYEVASGDIKVWIPHTQRFLYPDVMVIAGQPDYYENRNDAITNPQTIIEVLSKSTQDYDRSDKFRYYRTLPSFKEYVLISQYEFFVEQYTKIADYEWRLSYQENSEDVLEFISFPFKMSLLDIYNKVVFDK
jgi:Uma2 family endonuclease